MVGSWFPVHFYSDHHLLPIVYQQKGSLIQAATAFVIQFLLLVLFLAVLELRESSSNC